VIVVFGRTSFLALDLPPLLGANHLLIPYDDPKDYTVLYSTVHTVHSVRVPTSWPDNDEGFAAPIENPKTCREWKTVDTPKEMLYYHRLFDALRNLVKTYRPISIYTLRAGGMMGTTIPT
jgi:hypothetical protein